MRTIEMMRVVEKANVALGRSAWKKLACVNQKKGSKFIPTRVLLQELSMYLSGYEESGILLDTQWQELRYDDNVCVILRKIQGVWYVIDVWYAEISTHYVPLYTWRRLRKACRERVVRILVGWQAGSAAYADSTATA